MCSTPDTPINGDVYSDGKTANYTCDSGFTMSGIKTRYCASDGRGWNESAPTCSKYRMLKEISNVINTFAAHKIF